MLTARVWQVWKSVGAEKKGSAASHRSMTPPDTQQLASTRGYLPACTKLSHRSTAAIHTALILLPTKPTGLLPPELLQPPHHGRGDVYGMCTEYGPCLGGSLFQPHDTHLHSKRQHQTLSAGLCRVPPQALREKCPSTLTTKQNWSCCRSCVTTEKLLGPNNSRICKAGYRNGKDAQEKLTTYTKFDKLLSQTATQWCAAFSLDPKMQAGKFKSVEQFSPQKWRLRSYPSGYSHTGLLLLPQLVGIKTHTHKKRGGVV